MWNLYTSLEHHLSKTNTLGTQLGQFNVEMEFSECCSSNFKKIYSSEAIFFFFFKNDFYSFRYHLLLLLFFLVIASYGMLFWHMVQYIINKNSVFSWMTGGQQQGRRTGCSAPKNILSTFGYQAFNFVFSSKLFLRMYLLGFANIPVFPWS